MKNQYNFLKTIDKSTTTSSADSNNQEERISSKNNAPNNNKLQVKSSLSKLHNLVASKFTAGNNNSASSSSSLKQQQKLNNTQNNSSQDNNNRLQQRYGRIFTLSTQTTSGNIAPEAIKDRRQVSEFENRANQMQAGGVKQRDIGAANVLASSKSPPTVAATSPTRLAPNSSPAAATTKQTNASEKITPELAKCYDEIDQIYDYIRGLAPLPLQLRKIKSIDFEQIERDKRIQQLAANSTPLPTKQAKSDSRQPIVVDGGGFLSSDRANLTTNLAPTKHKTKVRQRTGIDGEALKEPNTTPLPVLSQQQHHLSKPNQAVPTKQQQQRIQGPLPIKVTTTTDDVRPNVKRVESLNLGAATTCLTQPAYLISSTQRGQLFRLPRAHSTSTLNKPGAKQVTSSTNNDLPNSTNNKLAASNKNSRKEQQQTNERIIETRTLPPLRQSKISSTLLDNTKLASASLGRQLRTSDRHDLGAQKIAPELNQLKLGPLSTKRAVSGDGRVLDLVESFVDDDDVSSVVEQDNKSETSSSKGRSLSQDTDDDDNEQATTSQENLTSASSSNQSSSASASAAAAASSSSSTESASSSSSATITTSSSSDSSSESTTSSSSDQSLSDSESVAKLQQQKFRQQIRNNKHDLQQKVNNIRQRSIPDIDRKLSNEEARSNEKWTEKSHSDYENETVSGITSSDSSSDLSSSARVNQRTRRRSRSSGTGSRENHGSHSNASSASDKKLKLKMLKHQRQSQTKDKDKTDQVEHIYEQIPAHKNLIKQGDRPQPLPHGHPLDRSYNQFRQNKQQQHQRVRPTDQLITRPFNYPVAYAPNIAVAQASMGQKHHLASKFMVSPRANYQQQQQQSSSGGGTYPLPIHAMRSKPSHMHPLTGANSQVRPLDHRHRLSMNNIHLLPYLNYPLVNAVYHPSAEQAGNKLIMSRSSSSGKLNRIRAPRLSPAQLIAQIQMPHALNKARLENHHSSGQAAASSRTSERTLLKGTNSKQQAMFVWQPASQTAINQIHHLHHRGQAVDHQFYRPAAFPINNMQNKRRSNRRLTAIGIEESLETVRHQNLRQPQQQLSSRPLESSSGVVRAIIPVGNRAKNLNQSGVSYFEPPQLMTAPLIDGDDDDEEREEEEEDDEAEDIPTIGSSEERLESSPIKLRVNTAVNKSKEKQSSVSNGGGSKKLLAHQQAAAFIQNRCLNSISDLHSFSSTCGTSDDNDDVNKPEDDVEVDNDSDGEEEEEKEDDDESNLMNNGKAINRVLDNNDEANFVSSRSFIKCYYGREGNHSLSRDNAKQQQPVKSSRNRLLAGDRMASMSIRDERDNSDVKMRRNDASDKLKSGALNKSQNNANKSNKSSSETSQQRPSVVTSPIAAMFVAAQQQQKSQATTAAAVPLVGEFLDTEGPILVRDRRIAALRSDLVRHYQHPTVKVAKVPAYSASGQQKAGHHKQILQGSVIEPKDQQASSTGTSRYLPDQQVGSTNTTNSTSSYEAAIKNSREDKSIDGQQVVKRIAAESTSAAAAAAATNSVQQSKKSSSSSGSQNKNYNSKNQVSSTSNSCVGGLIKVPKLNKQSHLLNRPLPKPPVGVASLTSSSSRGRSLNVLANSPPNSQNHSQTAMKAFLVQSPKQQALMINEQKMLVSTNLDSTATSPVNGSKAHARSQYLQDLEYRASRHNSNSTSDGHSRKQQTNSSQDFDDNNSSSNGKSSRPTTTTATAAATTRNKFSSNSLSPLALSITTHPSPTVTTCTSSGISSRLTAATHLASGSNGSSQRSSSNNNRHAARVKSFSELHKQSKQQQQQQQPQMTAKEEETATIGRRINKRADSFALMDDEDDGDGDDDQHDGDCYDDSEDCEDINLAADRLDAFSSPDIVDNLEKSSKKQLVNATCDILPTTDNKKQVNRIGLAQRKEEAAMSSNLRLFDERFSSKFLDQQLASSNDSLLESINFSGTLNRKSPEKAVSTTPLHTQLT